MKSDEKRRARLPIPTNPIIAGDSGSYVGHRDTLDRVAAILQLLTEQNAPDGLSPKAESGRYWIQLMLVDAVKYVSDGLDSKRVDS